jgi:hypothetical protein
MPITFNCPGCAKQFKVPDEMAGRSSRCTQCGTPLVVPSPAAVAAWQPQPVAPPPMPAPAAPSPYEVVDAAPPGGRFQVSRKMLMFAGAGVLGVVLLVAVVWGGYKLFFGGSGLGDEVIYLPNNCQTVVSLRPEQLLDSSAWKDIKKELPDMPDPEKNLEQLAGIAPSNIQQVVIGASVAADGNNDVVFVVKTVKSITADDIKSKKGGLSPQETKVGSYIMYDSFPSAYCVVDSKVVVFAKSDTLKRVLERNKAAELTEGLRVALKNVDFSKSVVAAMDMKDMYAKGKEASKKSGMDLDKIWDQIGIANPMGDVDGAAYEIDVGKDIKLKSVLLCKDSKTAEDMKKISDGMFTFLKRMFPKYGADTLETWESSTSGSKMTGSMTVKTESILKAIKGFKEMGKSASGTFQKVGNEIPPPR